MSEFSRLLDEIQRCAPQPVHHNPYRSRHDPQRHSRSVAIPRAPTPQFSANLFKAMESQLSSVEASQRSLGPQLAQAANDARIVSLRMQAAEMIERANGDMLKAIAAGELSSQETGERQILLNAFAHRMGLN